MKESSSSTQFVVKIIEEDKVFMIAPGQVRPIKLVLEYKNEKEKQNEGDRCSDVKMVLRISTNKGQDQKLTINLRCRKLSESFLFTFIDHDGSVQHAAAIAPLKGCASGICPVLLTLHGTSRYFKGEPILKNNKFVPSSYDIHDIGCFLHLYNLAVVFFVNLLI